MGRVVFVDFSDRVADAPTTGLAFSAPYYVNGGKQLGLQASLIWNPVDWVRFIAQYGHLNVTGGPRALGLVDPDKPADKRSFGVDTFAARAQVEF